jgi:signal transduction histidine kinase
VRRAPTLSVRLVAMLLAGFIALQLLVVVATMIASRGSETRPYRLPSPSEVAAMVAAIERSPVADRPTLIATFNQGLYTVRLDPAGVNPSANATTVDLVGLGRFYAQALPGHAVAVDARRAVLGGLFGTQPRPARFFAPVTVTISLDNGSALVLTSRTSPAVRAFLGRRALIAALAGIVLLLILVVAIRHMVQPMARLAAGVRAFAGEAGSAALPVEGPPEVRDLARAFNDMQGRIGALIAERTRMLAAIAHDMRTYLTRLRLRADYIGDPEHRDRAVRDVEEMAALLDDTLLLAQADAASAEPIGPVDLGAVLAAGMAARDGEAERLSLDRPEAAVVVAARPRAVRRILDNLVDNGLRYAGTVAVALTTAGGQAVLTITDDGPGIAPDLLARLGEPFVRGEASRNRESGGAGLGLAIVTALAARDGAALQFENRPGGGLRVTLRYRLAD